MADTALLKRFVKRCTECDQRFSHDAMFCPFDGTKLEEIAWEPPTDPLIDKVVDGRYRVRRVLGEGGMGTVYEVEHTALHRPFAMKVLRRDLAREPDLAARFMQEARATASIKHPNIVAISDFGRLPDEVPYFVMELLVGQTLSSAIKAGGPIPAARGVQIVLQIAAAVGAAHQARVVHRDLKPENVFLVEGPEGNDEVRIVDFGAAMILGASRLTKTGIVFGTPHYMSPEQASGQAVDHRADIYALGIIMYEMFTGKVPFEADTYMGVLTQHMFVQPVPPSEVSAASKHLGALEDVTLRALEKKPEQRYETMERLAADIERAVRFDADGSLRISPGVRRADAGESARGVDLANELELPSIEEAALRDERSEHARVRRARARRGLMVGVLAVGAVAGVAGVVHVLRGAAGATATDVANAPSLPAGPSSVPLGGADAGGAASTPPVASSTATAASDIVPIRPSVAPRGPVRPPHAGAPPGRRPPPPPPPSAPGEFKDPWAK